MLEHIRKDLGDILVVHITITVEEYFSSSAVSMHVSYQHYRVLRVEILNQFLYLCDFWKQELVCISPISV